MSRTKIGYRTNSRQSYNNFCKNHPDIKITFSQFKDVISTCNQMITDYVLETGEKFKLPFGFGELSVDKWKPKKYVEYNGKQYINLPVDWVKTKKVGTLVYNLNAHTDGFRFKWYWFKSTARFEGSRCFVFKPCRKISRKLSSNLKKPNSIYQHIYKEWNPKNH